MKLNDESEQKLVEHDNSFEQNARRNYLPEWLLVFTFKTDDLCCKSNMTFTQISAVILLLYFQNRECNARSELRCVAQLLFEGGGSPA